MMIERARLQDTIPYSDLVGQIHAIHMEAHDPKLSYLLGEIATEEDEAGRGMLSAIDSGLDISSRI
ncbi:MAG: hypothetical protein ACYDBJ_15595 [Aggregatilineales bacterium]